MRRLSFILTLSLLVVFYGNVSAQAADSIALAAEHFIRAEKYEANKQEPAAIAEYSEAIRLDPVHAVAYYQRGRLYYSDQRIEKAVADWTEAIRIRPDWLEPLHWRGNAYYRQGNTVTEVGRSYYEKALADYDAVIRLKPDNANTYIARGYVFRAMNKMEQAIASYSEAVRLKPALETFIVRGNAYEVTGDYEKAYADYSEAIRLQPDNPAGYWRRSYVYKEVQGDRAQAEADWHKAQELEKAKASNAQ